jgi:hypothetical protein
MLKIIFATPTIDFDWMEAAFYKELGLIRVTHG